MGKQSKREHKTIYQLCREECGLTRDGASELMDGVSAARIEKFEYELQEPTPYDILQMADCYQGAQICVTTTVHTNALSATAMFRKLSHRNYPALFWKPSHL